MLKGSRHTQESLALMRESHRKSPSSNKGRRWTLSPEIRLKMSLSKVGHIVSGETRQKLSDRFRGRVFSEETRRKLSESHKGLISGESHPNWIKDRTKVKIYDDRRSDTLYKQWHKEVRTRDNYKCRIPDANCDGRIEVHHILGYSEYPELRYDVNNGITLCHFHHPKKREEEKRLSPYFQRLVSGLKN